MNIISHGLILFCTKVSHLHLEFGICEEVRFPGWIYETTAPRLLMKKKSSFLSLRNTMLHLFLVTSILQSWHYITLQVLDWNVFPKSTITALSNESSLLTERFIHLPIFMPGWSCQPTVENGPLFASFNTLSNKIYVLFKGLVLQNAYTNKDIPRIPWCLSEMMLN